jgi:hypothetical protein
MKSIILLSEPLQRSDLIIETLYFPKMGLTFVDP